MTSRNSSLNADPLPWLLEPDAVNPAIRYFALTDLLGRPADAPDVQEARAAIMASGPVPVILDKQDEQGRWKLGNSLRGKMWSDVEKQGRASKWVTLRALRMFKGIDVGDS